MNKNKLVKKGMCSETFRSGYITLFEMGLIKNNIIIEFEEMEDRQ